MIAQLLVYKDIIPRKELDKFEDIVGQVTVIQKLPRMKGNYGFRTYIRSVLFADVFLSILDRCRTKMTKERCIINDYFFAKLLSGDGTLDIRIKNRYYNYPTVRIKIVDRQMRYLEEYAEIMKLLSFTPHIQSKYSS